MDGETRERIKSNPVMRVLRWTVPWIVLGFIAYTLMGAYSDYKVAEKTQAKSVETTVAIEATGTAMSAAAITLIDGLNMRDKPDTAGVIILKVRKGVVLTVFELKDGWYRVKAPTGHTGWVSANAQYVKLKE